jgi:hypothetical protein
MPAALHEVARWFAALAAALVLAASPAVALDGADEPDFEVALRAWLADNDAAALPAFAELAAEGNQAARILLSLIDRMPHLHADWLAGLARSERRALMRAPDGRSWMAVAAETEELARLWLALWRADTDPAIALAFADRGEMRAARLTLLAHAARERRSFRRLAADDRYPPELLYLAWAEDPEAPDVAAALDRLHPGDPQAARFGLFVDEATRAGWLAEAEIALPLARFCKEACGEEAEACMLAAYHALGGYRGLFALGPPVESLISGETWLASVKGARSLPRRIAVLGPAGIGNACLARFVEP